MLAMRVVWEYGPDKVVPAAVRWLEAHNVEILFVEFHQLLKYPKAEIGRVADFIGDFDQENALKALDRDSRRGRKKLDDGKALVRFIGEPTVVTSIGGKENVKAAF